MSLSPAHILELILVYKYAFLFLITIAEGPISTIIAGLAVSLGQMNFTLAYMVIIAGDIVGDILYYCIGYWGRSGFIEKWGKYVGLNNTRVARLEKHFDQHAGKTLILGKISHGIGGAVLVAAGIARLPFWKYVAYNFFASLPKSFILLLIGYYFGHAYTQIDHYFAYGALMMTGLAILTAVMYTVLHKIDKRYES